jgi:hypothetical protein
VSGIAVLSQGAVPTTMRFKRFKLIGGVPPQYQQINFVTQMMAKWRRLWLRRQDVPTGYFNKVVYPTGPSHYGNYRSPRPPPGFPTPPAVPPSGWQ